MNLPRWHVDERQLLADLETPVSAFLKLRRVGAIALLETVERGSILGRYSLIGLKPLLRVECRNDRATAVTADDTRFECPIERDPTDLLQAILEAFELDAPTEPGNLLGGAFGYLSYEYIRYIERVPVKEERESDPALAQFFIPRWLVTFDHLTHKMFVRTMRPSHQPGRKLEPSNATQATALKALTHAAELAAESTSQELEVVLDALGSSLSRPPRQLGSATFEPAANPPPADFEAWVDQAKGFIRKGDIFQVVLSQSLRGTLGVPPFEVYRALRTLNPSPYLFYLDFSPTILIGSSPEVLVKLEGSVATVRPIAGTRPRGADPLEDQQLGEDLLGDAKERAEHVMLVDLGRNDLGRVSEFGSVEVTDFMSLERYSHVMHLVSYVRGKLRPDLDRFDLLRATFPAGTVSGAPKIRAMEIIDSMEQTRRGPYSGAVGYFGPSGEMDLCIAIRTIYCHGPEAVLQAGAGIVADSDPHSEHLECRRKMQALLDAIRLAERGLS